MYHILKKYCCYGVLTAGKGMWQFPKVNYQKTNECVCHLPLFSCPQKYSFNCQFISAFFIVRQFVCANSTPIQPPPFPKISKVGILYYYKLAHRWKYFICMNACILLVMLHFPFHFVALRKMSFPDDSFLQKAIVGPANPWP